MSGTGRSVGDRSDDEEWAGGDRDDEQELRAALSAWADRAYGDSRPVPPMRAPRGRRLGWAIAITVATAAVASAVIVPVLWLTHDSATPGRPVPVDPATAGKNGVRDALRGFAGPGFAAE